MGRGREGDSFCGTRGSWELLLSRSDLKALEPKLSTTPASRCEFDLLNQTRDATGVDSLDKSPESTVKVLTKDGSTLQAFCEGRAASLRPASCI